MEHIEKAKEIRSMDKQKTELSVDDLSALVLLQSLDDFKGLKDEYGEDVTSLREKLDRYEAGMTFGYDELDKMDQSIENLEAAGLIKVEPDEGEIYLLEQGKEAGNIAAENGVLCKDSLEMGEKSIKGLTLDEIKQSIKRIDTDKLLKNLDKVLTSLNIVVSAKEFLHLLTEWHKHTIHKFDMKWQPQLRGLSFLQIREHKFYICFCGMYFCSV